MLSVQIDELNGIAILEPEGPLTEPDFKAAAEVIDPWIEKTGGLKGLVIHSETFPGWESFAALSSHLTFVKNHHKKITRVAFASDSKVAGFAEKIARHFVAAEIKVFTFQEFEQARLWTSEATEAGLA